MANLDLGRIKGNVATMVQKGAPESDIDKYISGEGTTIDAVKNWSGDSGLYTPDFARSAYQGAMNSLPVKAVNAVGDAVAGGIGAVGKAIIPDKMKKAFAEEGDYLANKDKFTSPIYTAAKEVVTEIGDLSSYDRGGKGNLAHDLQALGANAKLAGNLTLTKPLTEGAIRGISHPIDTAGKAIDAAGKIGGKVLSPIVKPAVRGILDSDNSVLGGGMKTALSSQKADEGRVLGKKMGVNFSAGELTGSSTARGVEDALANSSRWSSKFTEANETKTNAIVGKFKETLDKISPEQTSQVGFGEKLTSAYKKTVDSLVASRRAQGKADFGRAEIATGGKPIIETPNFIKVISDYIKEGESPTATPAQKAASKQAKTILDALSEKPVKPSVILDAEGRPIERPAHLKFKKITVADLQNGLAGFGEASNSNGGLWKALNTASDRRFSKAAKAALEADMDAAADSGTGEGAAALKTARDHYKMISQKISDIEKSSIGKLVGGAEKDSKGNLVLSPEKTATKFLSMEPTELRQTLKFLDATNPEVANMARRYTLESAFKKAMDGAGQLNAGMTKDFDARTFLKSLPSDEKLNALLGSQGAVQDVKDVASAMGRLVHYGAKRGGSATAQRQGIMGIVDSLSRLGLSTFYKAVVDDTLAEDLLNPQNRKALSAEASKVNAKKAP